MSKSVTVIGKPACRDCVATESAMRLRKIPFIKKSITDEGVLDLVTRLGYKSFPIVVVSDDHHWAGFNQSKILELAAAFKEEEVAA